MTLTPQEFAAIEPHLWKAGVTNPDGRACLDEIVRLRALVTPIPPAVRDAVVAECRGQGIKHEERVVSHLTSAFAWAYRDGKSGGRGV